VQQLNANLAQKSITISVTDEAKKWILDKTLGDRSYGARPLRRALQRYIEDPLSEALIGGLIMDRPAFLEVANNTLLSLGFERNRGKDGWDFALQRVGR
jgi:ATP-dependent Clp protease ATP-binding subunit ClpC